MANLPKHESQRLPKRCFFSAFLEIEVVTYFWIVAVRIPLAVRAVVKGAPINPPMTPPTAWRLTHPRTPPHVAKAGAGIKNNPIIKPATAAEKTEIKTKLTVLAKALSKQFPYPKSRVSTSKRKLVAVKPRKKRASGLNEKFIAVAMRPTAVAVPNFRVHHTARISDAKPIRSHRKGRWKTWKKIGERVELSTPHKAEQRAITATSRLLKYGKSYHSCYNLVYS